MHSGKIIRLQIKVNGIVQGVGFRPYISRLATENKLSGFVRNSDSGVEIEVEGEIDWVDKFRSKLKIKAPPLSDIVDIKTTVIKVRHSKNFEIVKSKKKSGNQTIISPDIAVCNDCLEELSNPSDRRYMYPFINCTNCGPRLTIIEGTPYDRKNTTMKYFKMCKACEKEYHNPGDRRFHAQPNACPACGPRVWYETSCSGTILRGHDAIIKATKELAEGKILAIKGLGGFHLAVDAYNDEAILKLRERKHREEKPFAVMIRNTDLLNDLVLLNDEEKKNISSYARPIILLNKNKNRLSEYIAPNNKRLGVMIAYTPLHHILLKELEKYSNNFPPVLIMTSANFSEEPIEITNEDAKKRLSNVADGFLFHNRDILIRTDDSVSIFINSKHRIIRRSRGYVPKPFFTKKSRSTILGVGAELKNTICLQKGDKCFLSQHIGDLTNYSTYEFFKETISYMQKIIDCKPEFIGYDLHPDYLSTRWVKEENSTSSFGIQHHHAHMASCMGELELFSTEPATDRTTRFGVVRF